MPGRRAAVAVVDQRADRDRARRRIDARIDARDAAVERGVRVRRALCLDRQARLQRGEELFRHGEIELDHAEIVERRDDRARIHEAAEAHVAQPDAPVERRSDDAIGEPRARGGHARFVREQRRLQLIELRFRQRLGLEQLLAALVLAAAVARGGLGCGQVGARLGVVELDQHVALADLLALVEVDRRDAVGNLRSDVDGLVGAQRAERFDLVGEFLPGRMRGDDSDGAAGARRSALGRPAPTLSPANRYHAPPMSDERSERHDDEAVASHVFGQPSAGGRRIRK